MATAGYLISRAAERPAILSLGVTIVAVRFFGIGRPVVRYLERLDSHDLALRVLGRVRTRFYERIEPLAPAQLAAYRAGDLLSRMVADVDALQNLYSARARAAAGRAPRRRRVRRRGRRGAPGRRGVLAAGLLVGGLAVPAVSGLGRRAARRAGRRPRGARSRPS